MSANPLVRYRRLSKARRALLPWAIVTLTGATVSVALFPFRKAIRFGSIELRPRSSASPDDIVWAVEAASRQIPWRTVCLQEGLAAQRMLRMAGIDARLHYGARHEPASRDLTAHVWVTVAGQPVIGGDQAVAFAEVAKFP